MAKSANLLRASDDDFDDIVLRSDRPVLVEFGGAWCGPCRALEPILSKMADEAGGKLKIVTVDVDAAPALAQRYAIRGVPTVVAFVGGERKGQILGLTTREAMLRLFS